MICPNCKSPINVGAQFCGNCGTQLLQPVTQSPQPAPAQLPPQPTTSQVPQPSQQPVQPYAAMPQQQYQQPPAPQYAATSQQYQQPLPGSAIPQQGADTKVLNNKFTLLIVPAVALSMLTQHFSLFVLILIPLLVGVAIYAWKQVSKLKQLADGQITEQDKNRALFAMAFDPIVAQAIYYFRLKNTHIVAARFFNTLGWKIFGLLFALSFIVSFMIGFVPAFQESYNEASSKTKTPSSQTVTNQTAAKYPEDVKANFINSCTSGGAGSAYCSCAVDALEKEVSLDQLKKAENQRSDTGQYPADFEAILTKIDTACQA